jgi:hypothetical protein
VAPALQLLERELRHIPVYGQLLGKAERLAFICKRTVFATYTPAVTPGILCTCLRPLVALTDGFPMSALVPLLGDKRTLYARPEFCRV